MKTILILSLVSFVAMVAANPTPERIEKIKKIHAECQADPATKIEEGEMEKFGKGEPVDEVKFSKHSLCMNVKGGLQKENGDIDKDVLRKLFDGNPKVDEIVADCGEKKGNTAEEAALTFVKCLGKYRPHHQHDHHHH